MKLEARSWRDMLGSIIVDPQEKERIANMLAVNPLTLVRWVNGDSNPRPSNLRRLLNALPNQRDVLLPLLEKEFADLINADIEITSSMEIPSAFYTRVLRTASTLSPPLRFVSITNLILQQAREQLDPERLGLSITVAKCMRPVNGHKVRSLLESIGLGTPPWSPDLESKGFFFGAESLAGIAVSTCRPTLVQDLNAEDSLLPTIRVGFEMSAVAYPILRAGRIAGSLITLSTRPNYFFQPRLDLISKYTDLIALAFEDIDFYALENIELNVLPDIDIQRPFIAGIRQRIINTMREAAGRGQSMTLSQAEELVLQQLEEDLIIRLS